MAVDIIKAIFLGTVEGITEFLPISSTGHLILLNNWVSFDPTFTKMFDVVIQLGAVIAVVFYFRKKIWRKDIWQKILVAVIPAIVLGALFGSIIEEKLFNPLVVACALILGGIVLVYIEKNNRDYKYNSILEFSWKIAFIIGLIQSIAMVPGISRAAATIIGAMFLGVSRVIAVEFSFFLAIPTMVAASGYSLLKHGSNLDPNEFVTLLVGFITAFLVALAVIKYFIKYVQKHNFKSFGYYRIILGIVVVFYFFI